MVGFAQTKGRCFREETAVKHTRERHCLSHGKAAETQTKGSVLQKKACLSSLPVSALSRKLFGRLQRTECRPRSPVSGSGGRPRYCPALHNYCLPFTSTALSLPSTAVSLPFLGMSLPFLGFPLPFKPRRGSLAALFHATTCGLTHRLGRHLCLAGGQHRQGELAGFVLHPAAQQ